ncbi:MAG TPA: dicarboxylate/amino acid:cation symporter [Terracidiphilus sp.]|nr:dicarboxylate/amino acid:cation symporter [Terracidiphilus sp.]
MKLHTKVLIGLGAGLVAGLIGSQFSSPAVVRTIEWMSVYGRLFIRLIAMLVVPLVVASMMVGITAIGDLRTLGRVGIRTLAFFAISTIVAAGVGVPVALLLRPGAQLAATGQGTAPNLFATGTDEKPTAAVPLPDAILQMVPANPIGSASSGDLFGVIVFTLLFGAAVGTLPEGKRASIVQFFSAANDALMRMIGWIMKLAPTAVFCLIASVVARFGLHLLQALAMFCLTVVIGLLFVLLFVYGLTLLLACRRDPWKFYRESSEVALMAFSTSSSSATLPMSIKTAEECLDVPASIASFVLPLGTTMNKNGSALYKSAAVVFIVQAAGIHLGWTLAARIVLAATLSAMTTAGVPGSGLVAIVVVLQMSGLGALAAVGSVLVAGVDRILDMARTTLNVIGSLVCAVYVTTTVAEGRSRELEGRKVMSDISK